MSVWNFLKKEPEARVLLWWFRSGFPHPITLREMDHAFFQTRSSLYQCWHFHWSPWFLEPWNLIWVFSWTHCHAAEINDYRPTVIHCLWTDQSVFQCTVQPSKECYCNLQVWIMTNNCIFQHWSRLIQCLIITFYNFYLSAKEEILGLLFVAACSAFNKRLGI